MEHQILEVGAGENPEISAREGDTLDIREDLPHIDFPGVDIAVDEWPIESETYDRVIVKHVLEHLPPSRMTHVFTELDRVLNLGGTAEIELPHAGTYGAATDLTHRNGGNYRGCKRIFRRATGGLLPGAKLGSGLVG
jgi:predicted SAM-dependent methyltransferase